MPRELIGQAGPARDPAIWAPRVASPLMGFWSKPDGDPWSTAEPERRTIPPKIKRLRRQFWFAFVALIVFVGVIVGLVTRSELAGVIAAGLTPWAIRLVLVPIRIRRARRSAPNG